MDAFDVRIDLPAYSHSFTVSVPTSSTIYQVKEAISTSCPGQPRIEGQRLISKGRNLGDGELVSDLWKAPSESRTLHLAVHPSAWTGEPPSISSASDHISDLASPTNAPTFSSTPFAPSIHDLFFPLPRVPAHSSRDDHKPMPYIVLLHQNALCALTTGNPPPPTNEHASLRQAALEAVHRLGWKWPAILDSPYPAANSSGEFLKFEEIVVHGEPYLSLTDPESTPSPVQRHALEVLSYTFTLLEIHIISTSIARTTTQAITIDIGNNPNINRANVNRLFQQFGLPELQNNGAGVQVREIPLRPLLMPLLMLSFRMVLLLYFIAPIRKPIFGVLILAWMLYELWQPVRNILLGGAQPQGPNAARQQQQQQPQQQQPLANGMGPNVNPPNPQPGQAPVVNAPFRGNPGLAQPQWNLGPGNIFNNLADLNLQAEQQMLDRADQMPIPEPSLGHRISTFLTLFFATMHPALWDRRRTALRRREGPIRTETNVREQPDPQPPSDEQREEGDESSAGQQVDNRATQVRDELRAKHARRPEWVKRYIERVVAEDWVEDSD